MLNMTKIDKNPMDKPTRLELLRIKAVADYLMGRGAGEALLGGGEVTVTRSASTGRVKNVYVDGVMVATVRASDGFLLPSIEGARRLLAKGVGRKVVVQSDVAEYIAFGRNVFAKHVVAADDDIRAGDEVIVVDEGNRLLAVGKARLSGHEMMRFKRGIAVRVRRSIGGLKKAVRES